MQKTVSQRKLIIETKTKTAKMIVLQSVVRSVINEVKTVTVGKFYI